MNSKLREVTERHPKIVCQFCHRSELNSLEWGKMYQLGDITVHYFCMLCSSNLTQPVGSEDSDGILGFLPDDIKKELMRGTRLRCKYCKQTGATIGCSKRGCRASYHFPCGLENNAVYKFVGAYESFCEKHREQIPENTNREIDQTCVMCQEVVDEKFPLCPPCCMSAKFHAKCVKAQASNAGADCFRCPFCQDQAKFPEAMKLAGVFVPVKDSSWELEADAFEGERKLTCKAKSCSCLRGREYFNPRAGQPYSKIKCKSCGTEVHMKCVEAKKATWECKVCSGSDESDDEPVAEVKRRRQSARLQKDNGNLNEI